MTDSEQSKKEITQVTKVKHPRRIAQGHKLAALMKKRKEELLLNKPSEEVKEEVKEQHTSKSYDDYLYGVGAIAVLAIFGYVYFQKKPTPSSSQPLAEVVCTDHTTKLSDGKAESKRGVFKME